MDCVATLTMNPAIDSSCEAETVSPTHKIRTHGGRYDPGGGGLNVARALHRFGAPTEAIYMSGGPTGALLDGLLDLAGLQRQAVPMHDQVRMSLAVYERSTGQEYRFVPEGPCLSVTEAEAAVDAVLASPCPWLVASGSLPRGVGADFFARLTAPLAQQGRKLVLDTSGEPLKAAFEVGGIYLAKPSLGEFEGLVGRKFTGADEIGAAALELVRAGKAQMIAVTMGEQGAILAHRDGVVHHPGVKIAARSATGAGDSFVAGMVFGLLKGEAPAQAFRRGIAAGTAAVLSPGTGLCDPTDVERILAELP